MALTADDVAAEEARKRIAALACSIDTRLVPDSLEGNQSLAVSLTTPKSAALFFDRVWSPPIIDPGAPPGIAFFGCTTFEVFGCFGTRFLVAARDASPEHKELFLLVSKGLRHLAGPISATTSPEAGTAKDISDALIAERHISPTTMYDAASIRDAEYRPGRTEALLAVVSDLQIVDEKKITWEQVEEFRSDIDALRKLRRMRNWLDQNLAGKSVGEVSDAITVRLEDYQWSLRKHGIETLTGTLSDLLEPSFLKAAGTAVGALWAGGLWAGAGTGLAELVTSGLVLGKVTVSLANRRLNLADRKRGPGSEVAFVHELKKLSM